VVVIADQRTLRAAETEVGHTLAQAGVPAVLAGGLAHDPKGAELLRGEWGGRLDKTLLIRTARETAQQLVAGLPAVPDQSPPAAGPQPPSAVSPAAMRSSAGPAYSVPQPPPAPPASSYPPPSAQPAPAYPPPRPVAAPPAAAPPAVAQPPAAPVPLAPPPGTAPPLTQPPPPPSYGGRHSAGASGTGPAGTGPAGTAGPEAGPEIGAHGWITA
jgi:hypothetical protein